MSREATERPSPADIVTVGNQPPDHERIFICCLSHLRARVCLYLCTCMLNFVWFLVTPCSLPGSSVYGILQARILEWVVISFSRGSSQPRDEAQVSCISSLAVRFFTTSTTCSILLWKVSAKECTDTSSICQCILSSWTELSLVWAVLFFFGHAVWCVGSSFLIRDWTFAPCIGSRVLTTGPPGKSSRAVSFWSSPPSRIFDSCRGSDLEAHCLLTLLENCFFKFWPLIILCLGGKYEDFLFFSHSSVCPHPLLFILLVLSKRGLLTVPLAVRWNNH